MKNFESNKFLTDIARGYSTKIAGVEICDFSSQFRQNTAGLIFKYHNDQFLILINREFNICSLRALWTTYHEVAHALKDHFATYSKMSFPQKIRAEYEADMWASMESGMLKDDGCVEPDSIYCFPCCLYKHNTSCPKGIHR